jgi:hypothetical protein
MQQKYGIIYLWFDRKKKKFYLGAHWGTIDDGYICSSRWMKNTYKRRPQDFKRRILEKVISNKEEMFLREENWLSHIKDSELGIKYYNLQKHWKHWNSNQEKSLTVREKLSEASKRPHQDPEYKKNYIEGRKKMPPQTQEQIDKRAKSNTGKKRTEETKQKISDSNKGKVLGPLTEEHRLKVSEALKGKKNPFYGKTHEPELKKRMNEKTSATMKGKIPANIPTGFWWNNGIINKRSLECPDNNWTRGRL